MEDLIEALQIFAKYDNPYSPTCCKRNVLVLCVLIDSETVSNEDKKRLRELGFFASEQPGYFVSFRLGSDKKKGKS